MGQHRNVAAICLEGLRSHSLCDETFQVGLDGMVTGSNDVPARFRFPSCTFNLLIEQVCRRGCMRGPNELLLFFRQIARKRWVTVRFQPYPPVCDFDMGEDICGRELFLKALCRFIRVRCKCGYIYECGNTRVRTCRSYDRAAVRVSNQDHGTADALQSPSHVGDILGVRIESVLGCDYLMSLSQKGRDQFAEARAIGPQAVNEDDARFALICHNSAPFVLTGRGVS